MGVVQHAVTVYRAVSELPLVLLLRIWPPVDAFSVVESVLKLPFVYFAITLEELALTLNDVCKHVALVDALAADTGGRVVLCPRHLAIAVHLRVHKVSDVVATIWPLELTETLDL